MNPQPTFALNHIATPRLPVGAFFELARALGIDEVEIRNDLPGVAIADGTAPEAVRQEAEAQGVRILTINALYPFDVWNAERVAQADVLARYAAAAGVEALVLCPLNSVEDARSEQERAADLRAALAGLKPILELHGIMGLVEPLGFPESALRTKRKAVDAIDEVGAGDRFRLLHDTFHHYLAGEQEIFPERTGLVHISGVEDRSLPIDAIRDEHRVLVGTCRHHGQCRPDQCAAGGRLYGPVLARAVLARPFTRCRTPWRPCATALPSSRVRRAIPPDAFHQRPGEARAQQRGLQPMHRNLLTACATAALLVLPAMAQAANIGVSMALFDDNFLTVLRNGMQDYADKQDGVTLQVEDAQNDVSKQLNQIQNFIAQGVDAIIVNPVDTDATPAMTKLADDGRHPAGLRQPPPVDLDTLPREGVLRRLEREAVRHAGDAGSLQADGRQGQDPA